MVDMLVILRLKKGAPDTAGMNANQRRYRQRVRNVLFLDIPENPLNTNV